MLIDICWKLQKENEEEEGEEGEEGEAGKEEASLHKDSRSGMLVFLKHAVELVVARCLHEKNRYVVGGGWWWWWLVGGGD